MADYYLVTHARGPSWDYSRPRREQDGWDEHAAFMDGLVEDGFVLLGGPAGHGDGDVTVLVVRADGEATVRGRFAEDPWSPHLLTIESVKPWSVWLRGASVAPPLEAS